VEVLAVIVDTHVHIASTDRTRYPLRKGIGINAWYERGVADVDTLLANMDRCGVDGAVLVQAHGAYAFDNNYCADARTVAPDRHVNVSIIDMTKHDRVEQLEHWNGARGMLGTRVLHLPPPDPPWLDDRATEPFWQRAADLRVRTNVCLVRRDLPALGRLLEWAPDIAISLDHSGLVELPGTALGPDALEELLALARFPNLHLKVSTHVLAYSATVGQTPAQLVRTLADGYGARRLMWSSDWPNAGLDYEPLVRRGIDSADLLDDDERAQYLGGTAVRIWPELHTK
jgi:predicted TIM-barrel fold metal-dependent hydrolase